MQKRIRDYVKKHQMIQENDRIVAGVSGGADSICLLFFLLELKKEIEFEFAVVHVNHQLRGKEADEDEEFVKKICAEQNLVFQSYSFPIGMIAKQEKMSLEETGRKMRYQAFEEYASVWNANKIALAHHRNDQAETMLYHMARGTGISGLCSLRPVRNSVIRPLLCMSRGEIEQYLEVRGLPYRNDSTNQELDYMRNKIRHQVIPQLENGINEKTIEHMADLADDLTEIWEYLKGQIDQKFEQLVRHEDGRFVVSKHLSEESEMFQRYLIQRCLEVFAGTRKDISRLHIVNICRLLQSGTGKKLSLPYGIIVSLQYGELWFEKERNLQKKTQQILEKELNVTGMTQMGDCQFQCCFLQDGDKRIPQKTYTKWIDYDKIKNVLKIRTRLPGDYIVINDDGGRKKLKDYYIDRKIPREERDRILLVADGSQIVWIVGHRLDSEYFVSEKTRNILQIKMIGGTIDER